MPSPERGLAGERTQLAWVRSGLSYLALAAVVLGIAAHRHTPGLLALSAALLAVGGAVWREGRRAAGAPRARARALALVTIATAAAGLCALVVVVYAPS